MYFLARKIFCVHRGKNFLCVSKKFFSTNNPKWFPWMDVDVYNSFKSSSELRFRACGGALVDSLLDDMSKSEAKIENLRSDQSLKDLQELVTMEIAEEESKIEGFSEKIRQLILTEMDSDRWSMFEENKLDARLEVKPGVGGDEALKWAQEIFQMYQNVSVRLGWSFTETGEMKALIADRKTGGNVFGNLRHESGVHRVQRVPFNSDRMQTSAAAVYIVPKIEVPTVIVKDSDLKVHISKKSSGAGGQSVNAAYQQVRMTHIPSGFTVVVNDSHAQQENRETALRLIKERVQLMEEEKALAQMAAARKGLVRTADRSEKVRSYNFQRNQVVDHRLPGVVYKDVSCEEFMSGDCLGLIDIWNRLGQDRERELTNNFLRSLNKGK